MDPHFDGVIFQTHAAELRRRLARPFPPCAVLDVRPAADYAAGHLPGALSSPPESLSDGLPDGVTPGIEIFVVGADPDDPAVRQASLALRRLGSRRIVELGGGLLEWGRAGGSLESSAPTARATRAA